MSMPQETSLRPYRPVLVFAFTNAITWMIILGTPHVLLGEYLGASPFAVSLAYSAVFLAMPVQVLATVLVARLGYKRQMMLFWGLRSLVIPVFIWLAHLARQGVEAWMVPAYVAATYCFCFFRSAGNSATTPWMFTFLPPHVRGRYFATDQTVSSVSGILMLVGVAAVFGALPVDTAFVIAFAVALGGGAASVWSLWYWPDVPAPEPTGLRRIAQGAPRLCLRPSPFRHYLLLVILWWLPVNGLEPLAAYYLKTEAGLGQSQILLFAALRYGGTLLGALWVRKRVDAWGVQPFFAFSFVIYALAAVYWLLLVLGVPGLLPFAGLSYFVMGMAWANWFAPNLKYLPQVCPENERPLALAVHTAVTGIAAGFSASAWGYFVKSSDSAGMDSGRFVIYLAILIVVLLALIRPFTRLKEQLPGTGFPAAPIFAVRLVRYGISMFGLASQIEREEKERDGMLPPL